MHAGFEGKSLKARNAKKAQSQRDKAALQQAFQQEAGKRGHCTCKQGGDQIRVDV